MDPLFVATIRTEAGSAPALVRDGVAGAASVCTMLEDWDAWLAALDAGRVEDPVPLADCTLPAPVADAPNLFMAGANHADHVRVISIGTAAGVGAGRGRFLAAGDVIRAEIEGIGALVDPVEAASPR